MGVYLCHGIDDISHVLRGELTCREVAGVLREPLEKLLVPHMHPRKAVQHQRYPLSVPTVLQKTDSTVIRMAPGNCSESGIMQGAFGGLGTWSSESATCER